MEEDLNISKYFKAKLEPQLLKQLIQKSDTLGLLHFGVYFSIFIPMGSASFMLVGSKWFYPVYLIYAIVFAFVEATAHELNHDTVFRSKWLNHKVHWLICFKAWREPFYCKYRH